jgi:prepilin-type N-terminal cleavage/methylation domain-containing protein
MKNLNTQKGFTLIELLVVVSIIALLASVVVAGLTDARGGAKNSKRNELARQYVTGLGLYHGEYGSYPERESNNTTRVCLGEGYTGGECYVWGSHDQDQSVNDQISEFVPGAPPSTEVTTVLTDQGTRSFWGMAYKCTDENCMNYELSWVVEGGGSDAECFGGAERTPMTSDNSLAICTYSTEI